MALSRRDWNNVIIYSVLAMLMLFYFVPQHLMTQRQQQFAAYQLIPAGEVLIQLQFERVSVQQAGQVWRYQPAVQSSMTPAELAELWQQTALKPWPQQIELSATPLRKVGVMLAGESSVQYWGLYRNGPDYYLKKQGFVEIFQLTAQQAAQLFPESLSDIAK